MHTAITKAFKRYNLFGFTGTPIFAANAGSGGNPWLRTTEQAFGEKLHTYTIVDAITDKNVLPFRIDYVNTIKLPEGVADKQVSAIDTERALLAPERIGQIVGYTLEHFDQKTRRAEQYSLSGKRVRGFNALFATASIEAAKRYYLEFKEQQRELLPDRRLKVGIIFSYAPNEAVDDYLDEEGFETGALDQSSRDFLEDAIRDYNAMFGTSFDTSADRFQNYYKDLSLRLKSREIDLVIVVNMFLTGFDATTLNTLFVDKNLRAHGLVQAYSRTNRILNSVKTYGNIVSFRDLEQETNDAIALFGNKDARGHRAAQAVRRLLLRVRREGRAAALPVPARGRRSSGSRQQKEFIALFGAILRLQNILTSFDDFAGNEILSERQAQDYRSVYLDLYAELRGKADAEKEPINDDIVFEIELIKQVEINVDYILMLVQKWRDAHGDGADKEIRTSISRAVDASPSLRNKKDLIEAFVDSVSVDGAIDEEWRAFVRARREAELDAIIEAEGLRPDETRAFINTAFRDGAVQATGTAITRVLPPVSRFSPDGEHGEKKQRVLAKLGEFFERFFGLGTS